ncbi:hypothetical protein ACX47_004620 [Salmonella enterica subsp. enterica serovar Gaminara]|nr:hypothetical protein [Salmonella enterica subsp. enterica serovar Gaminara]
MIRYNTIQLIHTVCTVHTSSLFFRSDPKKVSYGSSILSTPPGALSPQHMPQSGGQLFCM